MQIRFSFSFVLGGIIWVLLLHEIHEWGHQLVGKLFCGYWPSRDFIYWHLSTGCNNVDAFTLVALGGPLFTFLVFWLGWWFLHKSKKEILGAWGMILIFASIPFSRIIAVLFKGGDEIMAFRTLFSPKEPFIGAAVITGALLVLVLTIPPLILAYKKINANPVLFCALLIVPFVMDRAILEGIMNPLLKEGFLSQQGFAGAPLLVNCWGVLLVLLSVLVRKKLFGSFFFINHSHKSN
jgi:hypothetical protein